MTIVIIPKNALLIKRLAENNNWTDKIKLGTRFDITTRRKMGKICKCYCFKVSVKKRHITPCRKFHPQCEIVVANNPKVPQAQPLMFRGHSLGKVRAPSDFIRVHHEHDQVIFRMVFQIHFLLKIEYDYITAEIVCT